MWFGSKGISPQLWNCRNVQQTRSPLKQFYPTFYSDVRVLKFHYSTTFDPEIQAEFKPNLSVIGVGGGGCNTVENMVKRGVEGVEFFVCNTDSQVLEKSKLPITNKIQLGSKLTGGLGAGAKPDIGKRAAEEAIDAIMGKLNNSHLCFITAGMGGGTGTGASPVIGKALKEKGILSIGIVTKPFDYEGRIRRTLADQGIEEMKQAVDTLIVVPNQRVLSKDKRQLFSEAFDQVNNVLYEGIRAVTDVIVTPGLINLDFADVKTITKGPGWGLMGTGKATGKDRAKDATNAALNNPLLSDTSKHNATGVLVSIAGGTDLCLLEIDEVLGIIHEHVNKEVNIIFGTTTHDDLEGYIQVSLIITGPWDSETETVQQTTTVAPPPSPPKVHVSSKQQVKPSGDSKQQQQQQAQQQQQQQSNSDDKDEKKGFFSRWI